MNFNKTAQLFFLTIFPCLVKAQIAIIRDKDGYTNIREEPSVDSKIVGRMYNDDIFYFQNQPGKDWIEVGIHVDLDQKSQEIKNFYKKLGYRSNFITVTGYLHSSRVKKFSEMKVITANLQYHEGFLSVKNDTLYYEIKSYPFDAGKHVVEKSEYGIKSIDGTYPYGVFNNLPKFGIESVILKIRSKTVLIPKKEYVDLFEPDFKTMFLYVDDEGTLYIDSTNSDGAGGYELVWVIKGGKFVKREILVP